MFPDLKKSFKRIWILLSICLISLIPVMVSAAEQSYELTIRQEAGTSDIYTYQLSAVTANAPMPKESTLTLQGSSTGNYRITFTSPGDFTYRITNLATNESVSVRAHVTQTAQGIDCIIIAQNAKGNKLDEIVFSPPRRKPPVLGIEDYSLPAGLFMIFIGCLCIARIARALCTSKS